MSAVKLLWRRIYGKESYLNLAGKVVIGISIFPFVLIWSAFILLGALVEFLFIKEAWHDQH